MRTDISLRFYLNTEQARIRFADAKVVCLRRSAEEDTIVLADPSISRSPEGIGSIRREGSQLLFQPVLGATPVLHNGVKITSETVLQAGDRLRIGYSVLVVQAIDESDEEDVQTLKLETTYMRNREELGHEAQRLAEWSEGFDALKASRSERETAEAILAQLTGLLHGDRAVLAVGSADSAYRELAACGLHGGEVESVLRWLNENPVAAGAATPLIHEVLGSGALGRAAMGKIEVEDGFWIYYLEPTSRSPVLASAHRGLTLLGNLLHLDRLFRDRDDQDRWMRDLSDTVRVYARPPEEQIYEIVRGEFVFRSAAMQGVCRSLARAATASCHVLILGEPGTGKELAAEAIHLASARRHRELVAVSLAECPETLVEGLLFGHCRGAFTGATSAQAGLLALAHRSSLFLDEIGEIPMPIQVKLLRFLERGEFRSLGAPQLTRVDVRLVAATNRDLGLEVREGRFRQDLFDRLNVVTIVLPPLRDRMDDIPALAAHFLARINEREGKGVALTEAAIRHLGRYSWPDNVRGLRNYLEKTIILADRSVVDVDQLPVFAAPPNELPPRAEIGGPAEALIAELRTAGRMNQARLLGVFHESAQHWGKSELADRVKLSRPVCRNELQQLIAYSLDRGLTIDYFEERINLRSEDWDKITKLRKEAP